MKIGRTLQDLATEVARRATSKKDYLVDTRTMTMEPPLNIDEPGLRFGDMLLPLTQHAHRQLAEQIKIPAPYYDRMREQQPDLLAHNVNTWLRTQPETRMVRTLDGRVRAMLSDKYRPLENEDLLEAVFPVLQDLNVLIVSADITETRFYLKAVDMSVTTQVPTGKAMGDASHTFFDTLSPAITISNSEIGMGRLLVETGIFTKICTNLAMIGHSFKKHHVGGRAELTEETYALLSDRTRKLTDAAVWSQIRDIVKGGFEQTRFEALTQKVAATTEQKLEGDPIKAVEVIAKKFDLNDGERTGVLKHLIQGGDLTRYGVFNAVTRFSADVASFDRATELEQLGGRLIELPANDWKEIAMAA